MSVVTCREVLEDHGILYSGEYLSVSFKIMTHGK